MSRQAGSPSLGTVALTHKKNSHKKRFLRALARMPNISLAARSAGMSRSAAYAYRSKDEKFASAWDEAVEEALDRIEANVFEDALGDGRNALVSRLFLLKSWRRDRYAERLDSNPGGNTNAKVVIVLPERVDLETWREQAQAMREADEARDKARRALPPAIETEAVQPHEAPSERKPETDR